MVRILKLQLKLTTCYLRNGLPMLHLPCSMLLHQDLSCPGNFTVVGGFSIYLLCSTNQKCLCCYSCFLLTMKDDSIDGIYETLKQCAIISKSAGGIGLNIHCIRATGSYIAGTNGISNGLVPMLRVYNNTARYVDQGGNKVTSLQ